MIDDKEGLSQEDIEWLKKTRNALFLVGGIAIGVIIAVIVGISGQAKADTQGTYCEPQSPRTSKEGTRCTSWKWDSKHQKLIESKRLITGDKK